MAKNCIAINCNIVIRIVIGYLTLIFRKGYTVEGKVNLFTRPVLVPSLMVWKLSVIRNFATDTLEDSLLAP